MRSTKKSVVVAGLAIAGLALGACGGGTVPARAGGSTGGSGQEAKTIKLVAAEYSKDHTKAFWDAFAKTYKEKTGNTLEVQVVSWDNIDQQSSTMIQNNQAPDILNLNAYASYAKDGLLYNSDEVLPAAAKSDILDTFVKYGTYQGKFYGFPDLSSARALFYNKTLFKQAGIANPPKTWDELEADAKKIAATGNVGYALPLGPEESQGEFSMWLFNNGGDWKTDGKWVINSDKNVADADLPQEAAPTRRSRRTTRPAPTAPTPSTCSSRARPAWSSASARSPADLDADKKVDYGVAPFPSNDGTESKTFGVTDYLMAFKKPGNQDGGQGLLRPLLPA